MVVTHRATNSNANILESSLLLRDSTKTLPPSRFWAEHNSLKLVESLNHPHVAETLAVFRYEENENQYFNFLLPLALGNLKALFRGSYNDDLGLQKRVQDSLWGQFAGLSSAVAYLHYSVQMAHRDIKLSNIFIYGDPAPGGTLVLKLTGFGLSTDLGKALDWEAGSVAQLYGSHKIGEGSPNIESDTQKIKRLRVLAATALLADDIWKLGCVFIEMLVFLVYGGSRGVTDFRDSIRTIEDNVLSDMLNGTRFDEGKKVKIKVINWLDLMARKDTRAKHLQPILAKMLAKPAQRPTIEELCQALVEVGVFFPIFQAHFKYHWWLTCFFQADFPNIRYDDGLRTATLTPADQARPLSRTEKFQLDTEKQVGRRVDW